MMKQQQSTNNSSVKALYNCFPETNLTIDEARERLNNDFGDVVSVHKAFQMLGSRTQISPQVSGLFLAGGQLQLS